MKRFFFFLCILAAGCHQPTEEELWLKIEHAKASQDWDSTMAVSKRILSEFPEGKFAGWALFALAESHRFKQEHSEALGHYKIFIDRYPELPPHAVSLFLVGFIYGNNLHMYDSARWYYNDFLKRYPNHDLAPSVKLELESFGKSPHEALNEQRKKQRSS